MFPSKKFLLIDPNYHQFNAPFKLVYQNVGAIDGKIWKDSYTDSLGRGGNREKKRRFDNIKNSMTAPIVGRGERVNMLDIKTKSHVKLMADVQSDFYDSGHLTLFEEIIRSDDRVYIIQDYISNDLTAILVKSKDNAGAKLSFISDIRTNLFGRAPTDIDYMWNDALQVMVLKELKPLWSMIKFHPPYKLNMGEMEEFMKMGDRGMAPTIRADFKFVKDRYGLDLVGRYMENDGTYDYFATSSIYLQAFAPRGSSEARLIISADDVCKPWYNYSASEWDNRFTYYRHMRGRMFFGSFYNVVKETPGLHHYDGCLDCMLEMMILTNYLYREPVDSVEMDGVALAMKLKKRGIHKLRDLVATIARHQLYPTYGKAPWHGYLKKTPINPTMYSAVGNLKRFEMRGGSAHSVAVSSMSKMADNLQLHTPIK
jgi:hypothetical protein